MLFYLFSPSELGELFDRLGYRLDDDLHRPARSTTTSTRTSHGSTLSQVVHAWVVGPT